jgi:5-methylcytosine-specific restriction endonuclease McrA
MKRHVLLLNASEEVLDIISWERAVKLLFSDRVIAPYNFEHTYELLCTQEKKFELPSVLMLKNYVHIPYYEVILSKKNIFRRDNYRCGYCGKKLEKGEATVDHIMPRSRGGKNTWMNMITSCHKCNNRKGCRTPEQANMKMSFKPFKPTPATIFENSVGDQENEIWNRWLKSMKSHSVR